MMEMDHRVGQLLDALDALGLRDDTLFLFASDIADYVASAFSDGTTATSASATQATFPSYGDESGAVMITVPLTFPDGMKANVSITYIMIRQGRSIAQLVLDSVPGTFESSLAQSLAQTVTANMAKTPVRATN